MANEILTAKNAALRYDKITAFTDITLTVAKGAYFCIVGPNGSGKSSFIKSAVGLIPLQQGQINLHLPREKISYLPQINAIPLDLPATVSEIVMAGRQRKEKRLPFYTREDKKQVFETMGQLGVLDYRDKRIGHLSGGQIQRALLARALCRKPEVLILDEPCAGLDETISKLFYGILEKLHQEGLTIIMVSHDRDEVVKYATHIAEFNKKIIFSGTKEAWQAHRLEEAGLS